VPPALVAGVPMMKISSKKVKQVVMHLEDGAITWAGSGSSKSELPSFSPTDRVVADMQSPSTASANCVSASQVRERA
jgi:hypothetical protein